MRISDWSSDVCSSDLPSWNPYAYIKNNWHPDRLKDLEFEIRRGMFEDAMTAEDLERRARELAREKRLMDTMSSGPFFGVLLGSLAAMTTDLRSEEHTSELQSLMRISYAVFCLKKKNNTITHR